ncbi:MAG: nuclear transport factor 2 family protein [Hyphomicrobiaceae bacterium]
MRSAADDKDEIRELMAAYCHALDACRFADVAALFSEDGEWTSSYATAHGHAAIAGQFEAAVPKPGEGPQRKHYVTNTIIKLHGDTADAISDYLVVRESESGLLPVMGGTYRDRFVRTNGRWLFSRKELVHHIRGDMALKRKV